MKKIIGLYLIFWAFKVFGTTFRPVPIEKQVSDSYGVVRAEYQGKSYKRIKTGEVVTEASFKIIETVGLRPYEVINKNNFKIYYPGGEWQGLVYKTYGAPVFKKGEKSILLLRKGPVGFMIQNLSLGKYKITKKAGQEYLSSSVFPDHGRLGKISMISFSSMLVDRFGTSFKSAFDERQIYKEKKYIKKYVSLDSNDRKRKAGRGPASGPLKGDQIRDDLDRSPASPESLGMGWILLIMGLASGTVAFFTKRIK